MMQTVLIICLFTLVIVLSVLLVVRIRSERRAAAIYRMTLSDFSEFLRSNTLDGSIQLVAGKVSDLLKRACGCERIVFLRKRRQYLELNYFFGVNRFNRHDLRVRYATDLVDRLKGQVFPDELSTLKDILPEALLKKLDQWECDLYFPVFWRDHLYGLYFIKSTAEIRSPSFQLLVASMAQSLSAAYHIKWHEDKQGRMEQRMQQLQEEVVHPPRASIQQGMQVLKLVRHRNSETLLDEILGNLAKDLNLSRAALMYEPPQNTRPVQVHRSGITDSLEIPQREVFNQVLARVVSNGSGTVEDLRKFGETAAFGQEMARAGLKYIAALPLSAERAGLLVWGDEKTPQAILPELKEHTAAAAELVDNAESFERVEELSYTDNLTGLANRRYFLRRLDEEIDRAKRYERSLALIILDLDELKSVNDRYGHQAGDTIIQRVGELMRTSIRSIDVIARYGGDEFCVVMPEADRATCVRFMNRLQLKIAGHKFTLEQFKTDSEGLRCTISQGAAVYPDHGSTSEHLIYAADMALLKAKESGRNQFILSD